MATEGSQETAKYQANKMKHVQKQWLIFYKCMWLTQNVLITYKSEVFKAKFHYAIQLANQLVRWIA